MPRVRHSLSQRTGRAVPSCLSRIQKTKGPDMWDYVKLIALGLVALLAAIAANYARDVA